MRKLICTISYYGSIFALLLCGIIILAGCVTYKDTLIIQGGICFIIAGAVIIVGCAWAALVESFKILMRNTVFRGQF